GFLHRYSEERLEHQRCQRGAITERTVRLRPPGSVGRLACAQELGRRRQRAVDPRAPRRERAFAPLTARGAAADEPTRSSNQDKIRPPQTAEGTHGQPHLTSSSRSTSLPREPECDRPSTPAKRLRCRTYGR